MATIQLDPVQFRQSGSLPAGQSAIIKPVNSNGRIGIQASAGALATVTVEYTMSNPTVLAAGNALWTAWAPGNVSANTFKQDWINTPVTAIRISASSGPATYEVVG